MDGGIVVLSVWLNGLQRATGNTSDVEYGRRSVESP